jgi:hypothetical protein
VFYQGFFDNGSNIMLFKVVAVSDTDVVFEDLDGNLADAKTVGIQIMNFLIGRN